MDIQMHAMKSFNEFIIRMYILITYSNQYHMQRCVYQIDILQLVIKLYIVSLNSIDHNYIIHVLITQAHRCRQMNTTIVYIFIFFLFKIFLPLCEGWSYKQQLLASTNRKRWSICLISVHQEPAGYTGQYYPVYKGQGHTRLLHQCPDMLIIGKLHISFKQGVRFSLCSNR